MHEYQLTFEGESDAAVARILKNPEFVRSEYIEFGKNGNHFTGLAVYLTPSNEDDYYPEALREYGLDFLDGLSRESYYSRFITGKPKEKEAIKPIVDHFLTFDGRYHTTIAVLHNDAMIGAVSAFEPKHGLLRGKHVAEVSVTIADEFHHQGLGSLLLQRVIAQVIQDKFTHIIGNFEKENDASRGLVDIILGRNNLVAGKNNLEERYYRLGVTNPADDVELESLLRSIADDDATKQNQMVESTPEQDSSQDRTFGVPAIIKTMFATVVSRTHDVAVSPGLETQLSLDIVETPSQFES